MLAQLAACRAARAGLGAPNSRVLGQPLVSVLQALIFHDDLKARKRVLGRLGYLDDEGVVTLKASGVL